MVRSCCRGSTPARFVSPVLRLERDFAESGPIDLEIGEQSVDGLELQVFKQDEVAGVVVLTQTRPMCAKLSPVRQTVSFRSTFGLNTVLAPVQADGTFTLKAFRPDLYRVSISGGSGYIKSVRVAGVESDQPIVDLRKGLTGAVIELVVSSRMAELTGSVMGPKGPVAKAQAVLGPREGVRMGATLSTISGDDGLYRFPKVAPGHYFVFASDYGDITAYQGASDNYEEFCRKSNCERTTI